VLATLAAPGPARAAEDQYLAFSNTLLGLPVGLTAMRLTADDETYAVTVNARALGLYWVLRGIRAHRSTAGRIDPDGTLRPGVYREAYREWDKTGETIITYDRADGVAAAVRNGKPEDRVPEDLRQGVMDPFTALMEVRRRVAAAAATGNPAPMRLTVPLFMGKLRFDAMAEIGPPERIETAGQPWLARPVTVTFDPLAGFSEKHAGEYREGRLRLWISDHDKAIPLRIEVDLGWGTFRMAYDGRCGAASIDCPENEVDIPGQPLAARGEDE